MPRLVFLDDDADELKAFGEIVRGSYEYLPFHWPGKTAKDIQCTPDLVVLDLYLPPPDKPEPSRIAEEKLAGQRIIAEGVAECFRRLYPEFAHDSKRLLRETMACLTRGRKLLDTQWRALNQNPQNGIDLMNEIKRLFQGVPVVFYSRKITPRNVWDVIQAGAADAIQKGEFSYNTVTTPEHRPPSSST